MVQDDTKQVQGDKQEDTGYHSVVLVGTIDLYLLIRVSQVRDLYGLPNKTIPHLRVETFFELRVL